MLSLHGGVVGRTARSLGIPPGTGGLITQETRRKLLVSIGGSVALSLFDMLGVLAMLPMMQYITAQDRNSGALGAVNDLLGSPSDGLLVGALALLIVGAFVLKDVFTVVFRWWQLNFMAKNQVEIQARLLEGYLVGPYAWHLTKNTSDKLWTVGGAVVMGYTGGSECSARVRDRSPHYHFHLCSPDVHLPCRDGCSDRLLRRRSSHRSGVIRPRILHAGQRNLEASQVSKASLQSLTAVKEIKLRHAHGPFVETFERPARKALEPV